MNIPRTNATSRRLCYSYLTPMNITISITPSIPPHVHRWVHDFNTDKPLGHRAIEVLWDLPLALPALRSAIATAEAKVLLPTQSLSAAMVGRRTAMTLAEGEAEADTATIEVSVWGLS